MLCLAMWKTADQRADGVRIVRRSDLGRGGYIVIGVDGTSVRQCICCRRDMPTLSVAREVADRAYPLQKTAELMARKRDA